MGGGVGSAAKMAGTGLFSAVFCYSKLFAHCDEFEILFSNLKIVIANLSKAAVFVEVDGSLVAVKHGKPHLIKAQFFGFFWAPPLGLEPRKIEGLPGVSHSQFKGIPAVRSSNSRGKPVVAPVNSPIDPTHVVRTP